MPTTMLRMTPYWGLVRMIMLVIQPIRPPTMSMMMMSMSAEIVHFVNEVIPAI